MPSMCEGISQDEWDAPRFEKKGKTLSQLEKEYDDAIEHYDQLKEALRVAEKVKEEALKAWREAKYK